MPRVGVRPRVNPFSTRFVTPGAIPFHFAPAGGPNAIVARLHETGGRGQVVGPHGSGKSTLVAGLLPALADWTVYQVRLNTTHRELPPWVWDAPPATGLLVLDGFEQLGFLTRRRLKRHWPGLVVTAHGSMGLPDLVRTDVTPETAEHVIRSLVPPGGEWVLDGFDVVARLRRHRGSLREVLFELYDRWEAREGG
jgi:hypothetical protein